MTFVAKSKKYTDDGRPIMSVTTALGLAWPKQLTKWAAETVSGYALENWAELSELPLRERARRMEASVWVKSKTAALRGTDIHRHGEELNLTGTTNVPEEHLGPVEAYAQFLRDWDVKPLIVERPVLNRRWQYAGRPDMLAEIQGERWLLDIKTGGNLFESFALQAAGYANAEVYLDSTDTEQPWPRPDLCGIVHIGPDAAELVPVEVDERTFRVFLYCRQNADYAQEARDAYKSGTPWPIGMALSPPNRPGLEVVR